MLSPTCSGARSLFISSSFFFFVALFPVDFRPLPSPRSLTQRLRQCASNRLRASFSFLSLLMAPFPPLLRISTVPKSPPPLPHPLLGSIFSLSVVGSCRPTDLYGIYARGVEVRSGNIHNSFSCVVMDRTSVCQFSFLKLTSPAWAPLGTPFSQVSSLFHL